MAKRAVSSLGVGLGLRPLHHPAILDGAPELAGAVDWFEILSENYIVDGGGPLATISASGFFGGG